jgi:hypothetical protein
MPADRRSNRRVNRRFDDLAVICTRLVHVHQHLHLHIVDGMVSEVRTGPSAYFRVRLWGFAHAPRTSGVSRPD